MTTVEYETAPATTAAGTASNWREWLKRLGPLIGLVFVMAVFSVLTPSTFLSTFNLRILLLQTAVVGTAALGMTLIIISGGIDLSVGSNVALSSVIIALLLNVGVNPVVAALGGIIGGLAVGILIGALVTGLQLMPFIVTLGLMGALRGAAIMVAGQGGVVYPPPALRHSWIGSLLSLQPASKWLIIPPGVWLLVILSLLVAGMLRYTKFGRHVFAIGSNEQTARLCGINIGRTKLLIYAVAGGLVGIAAVLHFSFLFQGDATSANGLELDVIAAVVIGGASLSGGEGTILGSLAGALMMSAVANGCGNMGWPNPVQQIVTGGIIIIAATLDRLRHRKTT
jgi:ribose/xylose/arabinose/galactoside ABC-type transport system permease subunit